MFDFGFGMKVADEAMKNQIVTLINNNQSDIKKLEDFRIDLPRFTR